MHTVTDCGDEGWGAVQQISRGLLFTSALIKWFKDAELNGRSQIAELDQRRV